MNEVGAYDDISMTGIDSSLYEPVPADVQRRLLSTYPNFRLIFNPRTEEHVVIVKDDACVTPFGDRHLVGWSIASNFPGRLDGEQVVAYLRSKDKWRDEYLDKWAPLGNGPPGESVNQRTIRADNAAMESFTLQRRAASHAKLGETVGEFMDKVNVAATHLVPMRGAKTVSEWIRRQRELENEDTGRIWVPGGIN